MTLDEAAKLARVASLLDQARDALLSRLVVTALERLDEARVLLQPPVLQSETDTVFEARAKHKENCWSEVPFEHCKAHWAWACVDCNATGTVIAAPREVGDTEDYATKRAEREHRKRVNKGLLCREPNGCIRVDRVPDKITRIRLDESKTAERYDEIVKLRMLLLDIGEMIDDRGMLAKEGGLSINRKIVAESARWGRKGDCV